jgi:hypothetical protein
MSCSVEGLASALGRTQIKSGISRKGGAFSAGFGNGFDIRRCGIVIAHLLARAKITIPLP